MISGTLLFHSPNSAIKIITEGKFILSTTLQAEQKLKLKQQQQGKS